MTHQFHVQCLLLFLHHGASSGSEHTKSIHISTTRENWISWSIFTLVGIIHGICYYHLSSLSFKNLILDFMSRRNDIQAGMTHYHELLVDYDRGAGVKLVFSLSIKHIRDLKTSHSCQCRDNYLGEGTQAAQRCLFLTDSALYSISLNTRLRVLIVLP